MPDDLTLTTPETFPSITRWRIGRIFIDVNAPAIKLELVADTGARFTWLGVDGENGLTAAEIQAALVFINQGRFATQQGKTLQRWLLEQVMASGAKAGTLT